MISKINKRFIALKFRKHYVDYIYERLTFIVHLYSLLKFAWPPREYIQSYVSQIFQKVCTIYLFLLISEWNDYKTILFLKKVAMTMSMETLHVYRFYWSNEKAILRCMVDIYVNKRDSALSILLKANMIRFLLVYVMYEYTKMNV